MSVDPARTGASNSNNDLRTRIEASINTIAANWTDFSMTLIKSGLIGVYLTSLLFIIGWAYADRYFDLFGVSIAGLDRDVEGAFYVYALWALRDGWLFLIVSALSLVVLAFLLAVFSFANSLLRPFAIFVIAGFVIASFAGAFWLGKWRAERQVPALVSRDYYTFPRVIVTAKQGSTSADFLAAKNAGESKDCLRKLYMDRKHIYLYPGYESTKDSMPAVFIVPLAEIAAIEIIKNRGLCRD